MIKSNIILYVEFVFFQKCGGGGEGKRAVDYSTKCDKVTEKTKKSLLCLQNSSSSKNSPVNNRLYGEGIGNVVKLITKKRLDHQFFD